MVRALRTAASVLAIAALLGSGIVLCPCEATSEAEAHACCATASWRAADDTCCRASESAPVIDVTLTVDALAAPASTGSLVPDLDGAAFSGVITRSLVSLVSPPVPVLRI
jgi:hypothetical protein